MYSKKTVIPLISISLILFNFWSTIFNVYISSNVIIANTIEGIKELKNDESKIKSQGLGKIVSLWGVEEVDRKWRDLDDFMILISEDRVIQSEEMEHLILKINEFKKIRTDFNQDLEENYTYYLEYWVRLLNKVQNSYCGVWGIPISKWDRNNNVKNLFASRMCRNVEVKKTWHFGFINLVLLCCFIVLFFGGIVLEEKGRKKVNKTTQIRGILLCLLGAILIVFLFFA